MSPGVPSPPHEALVADLERIRLTGLVRLRHVTVTAVSRVATLTGSAEQPGPGAIEALLRKAVDRLGGGRLQEAAEYTYGLVQGTRDWPAADRRKAAAEIYRVSVDRFRKHYEKIVHAQVAESLQALVEDRHLPGPVDTVTPQWMADARRFTVDLGGASLPVMVHHASVDTLRGIDVVVCPLNTYLELANTYKFSVAAYLRSAGARRKPNGEIVEDLVADALSEWRAQNAHPGLPVTAGTVVPVPVDERGDLGFRSIYFAAVATPVATTNDYVVEPAALSRAVRGVFRTAYADRGRYDPPLASICFPLLGAGRGRLPPAVSFQQIWREVVAAGRRDPVWTVHFVAIAPTDVDVIVTEILRQGATELGGVPPAGLMGSPPATSPRDGG